MLFLSTKKVSKRHANNRKHDSIIMVKDGSSCRNIGKLFCSGWKPDKLYDRAGSNRALRKNPKPYGHLYLHDGVGCTESTNITHYICFQLIKWLVEPAESNSWTTTNQEQLQRVICSNLIFVPEKEQKRAAKSRKMSVPALQNLNPAGGKTKRFYN